MSKTSTRRTSRLTTPVMITFVVVAVLLLGLTVTSVVKAMTRGDDPVVVSEVLTGQSMEVNRTTGPDVIRFQSVRSPLSPDEDVDDTLDTCMATEAREHLESLAGEGTSLDVEIEAYANAPNGELWAEIYLGGNDLALHRGFHLGATGASRQIKIGIERVELEHIVVVAISHRRTGTHKAGLAGNVRPLHTALGQAALRDVW